jgi:hypothetical protein
MRTVGHSVLESLGLSFEPIPHGASLPLSRGPGSLVRPMTSQRGLDIFILGAGCSAAYGYPLAQNSREDLKSYGEELAPRPGCDRLRRAVADSVSLMERHGSQTIDRLVRHLHEQVNSIYPSGVMRLAADPAIRNWEAARARVDEQILDAKRVTMARFIELEHRARERVLSGYRDLLGDIFKGNRNPAALAMSKCRVLSFNYDRLFEKAFAEYFELPRGQYIYCADPELLNSGWRGWGGPLMAEEITPDRFCFLNLHGSALAWLDRFHGEGRCIPCGIGETVNDEFLWRNGTAASPIPPQPFIVFPHEKEGIIQSGHTPPGAPHLKKVWSKAEQLFQSARKIRVIGYSFDRNDRPFLMERLGRCPRDCKIVIEGKEPAPIVTDLKENYPELAALLDAPVTRLF